MGARLLCQFTIIYEAMRGAFTLPKARLLCPLTMGKFHKEMDHPGPDPSRSATRTLSLGRKAGAPPSPQGEGGGEIMVRKIGSSVLTCRVTSKPTDRRTPLTSGTHWATTDSTAPSWKDPCNDFTSLTSDSGISSSRASRFCAKNASARKSARIYGPSLTPCERLLQYPPPSTASLLIGYGSPHLGNN